MPRYLVRVKPELREEVKAKLPAQVAVVEQVLDYIVVEMPEELVPQVRRIEGVVEVRPERPVGIMLLPVERKLAKFIELAKNPFTLPQAILFSLDMDQLLEKWTTAEARMMLGAQEAEADGYQGKGIRIGVLDTGVDPLCAQVPGLLGKSSVEGEEFFPLDTNGHSTWCYSALGGKSLWTPFGEVKGVAPDVELMIYKVLGYTIGAGSTSSVIRGMADAFADGCKILSMSLGGAEEDPAVSPECRVAKALADQGAILCVAVGNDGEGTIGTPGNSPDVITVGSIDHEGNVAEFSGAKGDKPDCVAPGVHVLSSSVGMIDVMQTQDSHRLAAISGSSMSTPMVAGMMAIWTQYLKERGVELTAEMAKDIMQRYGLSPKHPRLGWGIPQYEWVKRYWEEVLMPRPPTAPAVPAVPLGEEAEMIRID